MNAQPSDLVARSPEFRSGVTDARSDPPPDHDVAVAAHARLDDILRHGSRSAGDSEYISGYRAWRAARNRCQPHGTSDRHPLL